MTKRWTFKSDPKIFLRKIRKGARNNTWSWLSSARAPYSWYHPSHIDTTIKHLENAMFWYRKYIEAKNEYNFYRQLENKYKGQKIINVMK